MIVVITAGIFWQLTISRTLLATKELRDAKSAISKLMILPKDEEPTLANVADKTQLRDKFLAAHSENGDQVLIYPKSQMAIIYRSSINKIVAVGSVTVDPTMAESKGSSLTIRNGTTKITSIKDYISNIHSAFPDLKIIDGGPATRGEYPTTIVIDQTNSKDYLVDSLAGIVKGKRGVVPLNEGKPNTDLLIILGTDQP